MVITRMRLTNWYVITGAPCSGKTAVISGLEQKGYQVVHEVARAYIDEQLEKGQNIRQLKADILMFESHILYKKIQIEQSLPENAVIFLDRAVPDSIAYYALEGLNPDDPIQKSRLTRYKKIFLFERLGFEKDAVRSENEKIAEQLDRLLRKSYEELDYDIIFVPVMPVRERIDFILQAI